MTGFGKALRKGLDILEALAEAEADLPYSELRGRVDVSPASFARFLRILTERGYAAREAGGRYRLGSQLAAMGRRALGASRLFAAAPLLEALAAETQQTAELVAFEGGRSVLLARREAGQAAPAAGHENRPVVLSAAGPVGRLGLAFGLGRPGGVALPRETAEAIRRAGYDERLDYRADRFSAAAAVRDQAGNAVGCLAIAAPALAVSAADRGRAREALLACARQASQRLGLVRCEEGPAQAGPRGSAGP